MAQTYTATASGGSWSSTSTWTPTGYPVAGDTAILNSSSGAVTVNVNSACATLTCTGYANTLAIGTKDLIVSGTVLLSSSTTGTITIGTTSSIGFSMLNLTVGAGGVITCSTGSLITCSGSWDVSAGTFTMSTSIVTFTAVGTGNTIKSGSNTYYGIHWNGPNDWTMQDNISASSSSDAAVFKQGTLVFNGKTLAATSSGVASFGSTFTFTVGTGTLSMRNYDFTIGTGITVTISTGKWLCQRLVISGTGTFTCTGASVVQCYYYGINISSSNFTAGNSTFQCFAYSVSSGFTLTSNQPFYNLTIDTGSGVSYVTVTLGSNITITNNLTIYVANGNAANHNTLALGTYALSVGGNASINDTITIGTSATTGLTVTGNIAFASTGVITCSAGSLIYCGGNWDSHLGTFTYSTSTVCLTGSGTLQINTGAATSFYNLDCAAAGQTTTMASNLVVSNTLTLHGTGTFTGGYNLTLSGTGTPFVLNGGTISITQFTFSTPAGGTVTLPTGTFAPTSQLNLQPQGSNVTYNFGGDFLVSANKWVYMLAASGSTGCIVNTNNYALTCGGLAFGSSTYTGSITFNAGSSVITVGNQTAAGGNGMEVGNNGGSHVLNLGDASHNATVYCYGMWWNIEGTGTITVNPYRSTVTFYGGSSAWAINPNGQHFYNVVIDKSRSPTYNILSGDTLYIDGSFTANGDGTHQITLGATSTSAGTISKSSGTVSVSYCTIYYSTVTGGAIWDAYTSNGNVNNGNNTGWCFAPVIDSHTTNNYLVNQHNVSYSTDSFLVVQSTHYHTTDDYLVLQPTKIHTTDSVIANLVTKIHITDDYLVLQPTKIHTTDSVIANLVTKIHTTDDYLVLQPTKIHTTDSVIANLVTKIHTTDSVIANLVTKTHITDDYLVIQPTKIHTTDSVIANLVTKTHITDDYLVLQPTKIHTTDSYLVLQPTKIHTTDSVIANLVTKTHTTDSVIANLVTKIHITDDYLVLQPTKIHTTDSYPLRFPAVPIITSPRPKLYIGSIGIPLNIETGVDLTLAVEVVIEVEKPSKKKYSWEASLYQTTNVRKILLEGDLDEVGIYYLQAKVKMLDGSVKYGATTAMKVYDSYK